MLQDRVPYHEFLQFLQLSNQESEKRRSVWKKRQVTIQEKIIEYTKVNEDGCLETLIESEKQQIEIVHLENEEGEFAHRETTQWEQLEEFNEQLIRHENNKEEFLHLKSKEDEFSQFSSV